MNIIVSTNEMQRVKKAMGEMADTSFKCARCGNDFQSKQAVNSHSGLMHRPSDEQIQEIRRLRKEGLNVYQIAETVGVNRNAVVKYKSPSETCLCGCGKSLNGKKGDWLRGHSYLTRMTSEQRSQRMRNFWRDPISRNNYLLGVQKRQVEGRYKQSEESKAKQRAARADGKSGRYGIPLSEEGKRKLGAKNRIICLSD